MADGADALATNMETEAPVVETPEVSTGIPETDLPATETQEPVEPVEQPEVKAEPAKEPREVSKLLRELREQHPDKAQLLRRVQEAFFRAESYAQHYESPELAQRAKVTFDALGGDEGIATLQQAAEQVQRLDQWAETGDPELINAWTKESPEGFKKAVPLAIEALEKMDPRTYESALQPHVVRAILSSGAAQTIQNIAQYLQNVSDPVSKELMSREIKALVQWVGSLQELDKQRQTRTVDPRSGEIETQRQELATRTTQLLNQQIASKLEPWAKTEIDKSIASFAGKTQLPAQQKNFLMMETAKEIDAMLGKDKVYQNNLSALRSKGDVDKLVSYTQATIGAIKGIAAKAVWARSGFQAPQRATPKAPPNGQPRTPVNNAPLQLPSKPSIADLDLVRDPDRMLFISGKGYLKAGPNKGRLVTWKRAAS